MRTLPQPTRSTTSDLDIVIARSGKSRTALEAERQTLLDLFTGYTTQSRWDFDNLSDLSHVPADVRKAMLRSYSLTYNGRALADLRSDLLSLTENLCPYCRLLPATTLDHFLAKSQHETFASFSPNLVPMCALCNTYKCTKGTAKARQFFTHAYYDQLAGNERFLIAQVAVGKKHIATNFIIDFSANIDAHIFQRLAYQMSVLRLVPRYQLESVDIIYDQALKLQDMEDDGCTADDIRVSLVGDARNEAKAFGASYWKAALLSALAENLTFCSGGFRKAL